MKFYTWKDVERYFLLHRASWESAIAAVDVYPTDITVYASGRNPPGHVSIQL